MSERPAFTAGVDRYEFVWENHSTTITLERIREDRDGNLRAELVVRCGLVAGYQTIYRANTNLHADRTVQSLVRALTERTGKVPWAELVLQVVDLATAHFRTGDPLINLDDVDQPEDTGSPDWVMNPYVVADGATVFFAKGGSGKGYFASALAVSIATGEPVLGVVPNVVGPVAYLDWEASQTATHRRLLRVAKGAGVPMGRVFYKRMKQSVHSAGDALANELADQGCAAVVIDSLGLARGGAPESAEHTIAMFNAIARLGLPAICIDHVSKSAMSGDGAEMPIGSVYTENSARCVWSLKSEQRVGELSVHLRNTKVNDGPRARDEHMTIIFGGTSVRFATGTPPPPRSGTVLDQMVAFITNQGGSASVGQIARAIGKSEKHVRAEVSRHSDRVERVGGMDLIRVADEPFREPPETPF